jgi:hypothetical protein
LAVEQVIRLSESRESGAEVPLWETAVILAVFKTGPPSPPRNRRVAGIGSFGVLSVSGVT